MTTGIYLIVSPTNRKYVGQAIDIEKRWSSYRKLQNCREQPRLYNSFLKHGVETHTFSILEECLVEQLNEREVYWGLLHKSTDTFQGLGLRLGNNTIISDLTRENMSKSKKGKTSNRKGIVLTQEVKDRMSLAKLGKKHKPHSQQTRDKIGAKKKDIPLSEEHKQALRNAKRKPRTPIHCE